MLSRVVLSVMLVAAGAGVSACALGRDGGPSATSPHAAAKPSAQAPKAAVLPVGGTLPTRLKKPSIVVLKSQRRLVVYDGKSRRRVYEIGLSRVPVGDKEREGDRKTPEGTFYVCMKNPDSKYHRSLGLSYPNKEDAARGIRAGLIDSGQGEDIDRAIDRGAKPPWDTALGGEIMIHGQGPIPRVGDWTTGCIALTNDEIEELFAKIPDGTPVTIKP